MAATNNDDFPDVDLRSVFATEHDDEKIFMENLLRTFLDFDETDTDDNSESSAFEDSMEGSAPTTPLKANDAIKEIEENEKLIPSHSKKKQGELMKN